MTLRELLEWFGWLPPRNPCGATADAGFGIVVCVRPKGHKGEHSVLPDRFGVRMPMKLDV